MSVQTVLVTALLLGLPCVTARAQIPTRAGLVAEYLLATDARDTSGNGSHGRSVGAATYERERTSACLALDGQRSFVETTTNLAALSDTFAVELWVKPAASQVPYADILGNHAGDFTGFVLQQEGGHTNRYYFTYGTGRSWVYTPPVQLAAGEWQHVAIVKTRTDLRFYLNGLLAGSSSASQPMALSRTNLMIGLGIAGEPRCFTGRIRELRIWDRPVDVRSRADPSVQLRQFVRTGRVDRTASARWYVFGPRGRREVTFALDPERTPPSVQRVTVALRCWDARGRRVRFPARVALRREAGFRASIRLPASPGYHRVTCTPVAVAVAGRHTLPRDTFSYLVSPPPRTSRRTRQHSNGAAAMPTTPTASTRVIALDGEWRLATDPKNEGRERRWWTAPLPGAVAAKVPWTIQAAFPGYHGVAWYQRKFTPPANPHRSGRTLLRFHSVDYKADVWLNARYLGSHEGQDAPFTFDVTGVAKPGVESVLTVRVLNPTHEPIDGITLTTAPRRAKVIPYSAGASYNSGGITDSVELLLAPAAYVEELCVRPDWRTGAIHAEVSTRSATRRTLKGRLTLSVAPAAGGETIDIAQAPCTLPPGETTVTATLQVANRRLWELTDPFLYRVTARLTVGAACDERSTRCGFRDFRFENGYFRLNGRRIFLRGSHTVNSTPVSQHMVDDLAWFQRDVLFMKTMGFNCIRFIWGGSRRRQLDICDEMGLLVYQESAAANPMQDSPQMAERFDRAQSELIRRDRNHPSIVIWGLLNETPDGPVFRHATGMLPLVRSLDPDRVVMLNSGRWDNQLEIGSLCNPGSGAWEALLGGEGPGTGTTQAGPYGGYTDRMGDVHAYPPVPQPQEATRFLHELGRDTKPVFLSEHGIGSAVDLWRIVRTFEQIGNPDAEDARYYRERLDRFLADWERWKLADVFASPADLFAASVKRSAGQRTLSLDALRSNPHLVGYSLTGMVDHVNCGEGLFTLFRDLKPGTTDALYEGLAPLRLCTLLWPEHMYAGGKARIEVWLANEEVLPAGEYPVQVQLVAPNGQRVWARTATVRVPERRGSLEPPLALPVLDEEVTVPGPGGAYRCIATMEAGGAPGGGETVLHVTDGTAMPPVENMVTLWGDDPDVAKWLAAQGVETRRFGSSPPAAREVILVGRKPEAGGATAFATLAERIARGSTAVFLCAEVFAEGDNAVRWLPLANKGRLGTIYSWLYLKDDWARAHPIFDGLPAGGLLDHPYYRELITQSAWQGQDPPDEAVAGAIKASQDYESGLTIRVDRLGAGRIILNTLDIRAQLGRHPAAERLLRNLLRYAGRDAGKPLESLPADWQDTVKAMGY